MINKTSAVTQVAALVLTEILEKIATPVFVRGGRFLLCGARIDLAIYVA